MAIKIEFPTIVGKDNRITIPTRYNVHRGDEVTIKVIVTKKGEISLAYNAGLTSNEEINDD